MISWFCLMEYMQQNREQSGLPTVSSREPVHSTYAMRSGTLPSPGRRIVLNGRVGASRRSICMPVMTFLKRPKPYSGLASAVNSLKPVETTTAPTSTSSSVSRACRSMQSAGQAATHSPHSQQTAQSRQRAAPAWASASVMGGSISSKPVGAPVGRRDRRLGEAQRVALLLGDDLLLVHDRQSVVEAGHRAAGEPAVDHVRGTPTLSDGARDVRGARHHVAGREDVAARPSGACPGRRPGCRCRWPRRAS